MNARRVVVRACCNVVGNSYVVCYFIGNISVNLDALRNIVNGCRSVVYLNIIRPAVFGFSRVGGSVSASAYRGIA